MARNRHAPVVFAEIPIASRSSRDPVNPAADLYLDLMAKVLTRYGFEGRNVTVHLGGRSYESYLWELLRGILKDRDIRMVETGEFDAATPRGRQGLAGRRRVDDRPEADGATSAHCVESVIADDVPGDLIETGAWRGGSTIYMRAILAAYGVTDRTVWVADSFEGLPRAGRQEARRRHRRPAPHPLATWRSRVEDGQGELPSATTCSTTR